MADPLYIETWRMFDLFISGIAFTILLIGSYFFYKRGQFRMDKKAKVMLYGYALIVFDYAIMMILIYFTFSFHVGKFENMIFYSDINNSETICALILLSKITTFTAYIPNLLIYYTYEKNFNKTKYPLSIMMMLLIFFSLFLPYNSELMVIIYVYASMSLFIILKYAKKSNYEFRIISQFILFALFCFGWSAAILGNITLYKTIIVPSYVFASLGLLGALFLVIPLALSMEGKKERSLKICILLNFIEIVLQILLQICSILSGVPLLSILISSFFTIIYFYFLYVNLNALKSFKSGIIEKRKEETDLLRVFERPKKITEEEITISKEKKSCLVCKNRVGGFNFICEECGAFYCKKCIEALIETENACWVCETPFDKSKPQEISSETESEEKLDAEIHKKA